MNCAQEVEKIAVEKAFELSERIFNDLICIDKVSGDKEKYKKIMQESVHLGFKYIREGIDILEEKK
jgi:hypothetical protein